MPKKEKVIKSLFYKFLERCGTQGIQFVVGIILARILSPSDYGALALITVFVTLANTFIQTGLSTALIQNKDTTEDDYSTVFYMCLVLSIILYIFLFCFAPLISMFYEKPILTPLLRVLSITLFFGAYNSIQTAMLTRQMKFKSLLWLSLGAIIVSGIIGVSMAFLGFGIWSLIGQQLTYHIIVCVILSFSVHWHPKLVFEKDRAKIMFAYGWKLMLSSLINSFYNELRNLVIGKKFSDNVLGYYSRARQFPQLLVNNINSTIQTVMLPALAAEQENMSKVKSMMRRSIVTSTFFVFPMLAGLAAMANPLVTVLLTEKWLPCVFMMQLLCINMAFYPIHTANLQALNAMGRSDVYLKIEVIKKLIGVSILIFSIIFFDDIMIIIIGGILGTVIESFINAYPNKKILNYSYFEQIKDIFPSFLLTLLMLAFILPILLLNLNPLLTLFLQMIIGASVYFTAAKIAKLECFNYVIKTIKQFKGAKK